MVGLGLSFKNSVLDLDRKYDSSLISAFYTSLISHLSTTGKYKVITIL